MKTVIFHSFLNKCLIFFFFFNLISQNNPCLMCFSPRVSFLSQAFMCYDSAESKALDEQCHPEKLIFYRPGISLNNQRLDELAKWLMYGWNGRSIWRRFESGKCTSSIRMIKGFGWAKTNSTVWGSGCKGAVRFLREVQQPALMLVLAEIVTFCKLLIVYIYIVNIFHIRINLIFSTT